VINITKPRFFFGRALLFGFFDLLSAQVWEDLEMTWNGKARDLYEQRKTLKRQLDRLEQDEIQPFIVGLHKTLPSEWRETFARNNIFTQVLELGKARIVFSIGSGGDFHTKEEALQKCRKLQGVLTEYMGVALGTKSGLIELTFILDPDAV